MMLKPNDCKIEVLARLVLAQDAVETPLASERLRGVPIYDCRALRPRLVAEPGLREQLQAEWVDVFARGAGVLALRGAYADLGLIDEATVQFRALIDAEKRAGTGGGDHFAKPGANDRVWNALEKLCLRDPTLFAAYYANDIVDMVSEAWLGPAYQITSQINCVNPGGTAQMAHRDYHLGFMMPAEAARYPAHVHTALSPMLTLQGAVAHVDMPLVSGPTLYLPHSQKYPPGYMAPGRLEFQTFFDEHHVQLPLAKGDAMFFNPALLHAAGNNRSSDILRLANLLQVSSAFGRAMEAVNRVAMSEALYPALLTAVSSGKLTRAQAGLSIKACAEGYAFPTNLDRDPPIGGLAPQSQQGLMAQALDESWDAVRFATALQARAQCQRT